MKKSLESLKEIYLNHKKIIFLMGFLMVTSLALFIFSLVRLSSAPTVVRVSYGDISAYQGGDWMSMANSGGYHDGAWRELIAYPLLAVLFFVFHNLLAIKIFQKKGEGVTLIFLVTSILLVFLVFLEMTRLLG